MQRQVTGTLVFRVAPVAGVLALALACTDRDRPGVFGPDHTDADLAEPDSRPLPGPALNCTVAVADLAVECRPPGHDGVAPLAIVGDPYVSLRSEGTSYDPITEIFQTQVAVTNEIDQPLGTADGENVHPDGIRVFFFSGPTVTDGAGEIQLLNADGATTFTAPGQPFFQYDEILLKEQESQLKTWQWSIEPTVLGFAFSVFVSASVPHEDGWIVLDPAGAVLDGAGELQLVATALSAVGNVAPNTSFDWVSSDGFVASVTENGLVAATGEGYSIVTASSGSYSPGTSTIIVGTPFSGSGFISPDLITPADPTAFEGLTPNGQGERTMFDRRVNDWITVEAYLFDAAFDDGLSAEIQVNPEFTAEAAQTMAEKYAEAIGRLPTALRADMETVWIHMGVEAFGGGNNNILIHTGQGDLYEDDGVLEEILMHEAVHTSLDAAHALSAGWLAARDADPAFISAYAREFPDQEDLAESFGPWFAVRYRRDRIPPWLADVIELAIPNRLQYLDAQGFDLHPAVPAPAVFSERPPR